MHSACGRQKTSGSPKQEREKAKNYMQMLFDPHLYISAATHSKDRLRQAICTAERDISCNHQTTVVLYSRVMFMAELFCTIKAGSFDPLSSGRYYMSNSKIRAA